MRYVHSTDAKLGLGAKRNRCVELAAGAVVACFDDDNVYGPDYLRVMLAHLRHSGARCVCLVRWTTYSVADDAFYVEGAKWSGIHHLRSANGETLVYRKPDRAAPVVGDVDEYPPDRNVDEDRVAMFTALSHDSQERKARSRPRGARGSSGFGLGLSGGGAGGAESPDILTTHCSRAAAATTAAPHLRIVPYC